MARPPAHMPSQVSRNDLLVPEPDSTPCRGPETFWRAVPAEPGSSCSLTSVSAFGCCLSWRVRHHVARHEH